jgi:hypothetical protein
MDYGTRRLLLGIGIGFGAAVTFPFVAPVAAAILRPLTKVLLKQGFLALEHGRERLAQALEGLEDIVAEVRAEVEQELSESAQVTGATATSPSRAGTPEPAAGGAASASPTTASA